MNTPRVSVSRLVPLDLLRGLIMAIMALDHTRDFFHEAAGRFAPDDLTKTTPAIFFTRWITHFCAPVFAFTAGVSAYLWWQRGGRTRGDLSRYLLTRGLWLILLEVTVFHFALFFNGDFSVVLLTILWALGGSMVALAGLVYLPQRVLLALAGAIVVLHNLTDGISPASLGWFGPIWTLLHQRGVVTVFKIPVVVGYPLLPWIGVMALGFACGPLFADPERYRLRVRWAGLGLTLAFVLLRAVNVYGDLVPWKQFSLLSFLNCTKYPPSLDFLLMTLGPALVLYTVLPREARTSNPLLVFGRVPLFYFLAHFFVIHLLALLAGVVFHHDVAGLLKAPPFAPALGYSLAGTYLAWLTVLLIMYPLCRWYGGVKQARGSGSLLRYL